MLGLLFDAPAVAGACPGGKWIRLAAACQSRIRANAVAVGRRQGRSDLERAVPPTHCRGFTEPYCDRFSSEAGAVIASEPPVIATSGISDTRSLACRRISWSCLGIEGRSPSLKKPIALKGSPGSLPYILAKAPSALSSETPAESMTEMSR